MKIITTALVATLPLTQTSASLQTPRQSAPWSLTNLAILIPNHREGTYPWSTFTATIADPNTYTLNDSISVSPSTGTNCAAKFLDLSSVDEGPWGRGWACDDDGKGEGHWEMRVHKTESGYRVVFTHVAARFDKGALKGWKRWFEGPVELEVGKHLTVSCAGDGTCGYTLAGAPMEVVGSELEW